MMFDALALTGGIVVAQLLADIGPSVSPARLLRYQDGAGDSLQTVVNYLWNVELCESLYYSLNMVEVALRNGLHRSLSQHFGVPHWYDGRGILEPRQALDVAQVKARISGRGDPVTPDRVVSELTFGFWVTILSRNYDARLWAANNASPLKGSFFALARRQRRRQVVHHRYNAIRAFRNRVMHHEPVFDDPQLAQRHSEVRDALFWLNPRMVDLLDWFDRFDDVQQRGRGRIEQTLRTRLGPA